MPSSYFNSAKVCGEGKSEEWLHGLGGRLTQETTAHKKCSKRHFKDSPPERTTTTTTTIFIVLLIQKCRVIKRK